jgi:hypothetical protein
MNEDKREMQTEGKRERERERKKEGKRKDSLLPLMMNRIMS